MVLDVRSVPITAIKPMQKSPALNEALTSEKCHNMQLGVTGLQACVGVIMLELMRLLLEIERLKFVTLAKTLGKKLAFRNPEAF